MTEQYRPPQQIIDQVPGAAPRTESTSVQSTDAIGSRRNPVIIEGSVANPKKVIGHPSNEFSGASQAYAEHLSRGKEASPDSQTVDSEAASLTIGSVVVARRKVYEPGPNGTRKAIPGFYSEEAGWKIASINDGKVTIEKPQDDGKIAEKTVTISELMRWQPGYLEGGSEVTTPRDLLQARALLREVGNAATSEIIDPPA